MNQRQTTEITAHRLSGTFVAVADSRHQFIQISFDTCLIIGSTHKTEKLIQDRVDVLHVGDRTLLDITVNGLR